MAETNHGLSHKFDLNEKILLIVALGVGFSSLVYQLILHKYVTLPDALSAAYPGVTLNIFSLVYLFYTNHPALVRAHRNVAFYVVGANAVLFGSLAILHILPFSNLEILRITVGTSTFPFILPLASACAAMLSAASLLNYYFSSRKYSKLLQKFLFSTVCATATAGIISGFFKHIGVFETVSINITYSAGLAYLAIGLFGLLQINSSLQQKIKNYGLSVMLAVLVGLVVLSGTGFIWSRAVSEKQDQNILRFVSAANAVSQSIENKISSYSNIIISGSGLFNSSETVTRDEWKLFVESFDLATNFPGMLGFGFAQQFPKEDLTKHTQEIRAQGFPEYAVRPQDGTRETYTAIIYLEPFDERNQRAFGFDMTSEETRRIAMNNARDTDSVTMSGSVILVQETNSDIQYGFLLYSPVYRKQATLETVNDKRNATIGYSYAPFRVKDFLKSINDNVVGGLELAISDIPKSNEAERTIFTSEPSSFERLDYLTHTTNIDFGGHTWTIRFSGNQAFINQQKNDNLVYGILMSGVALSFVLPLFIIKIGSSRQEAVAYAESLTQSLHAEKNDALLQQEKLNSIVSSIGDGLVILNERGEVERINQAAAVMLGYGQEDLKGRSFSQTVMTKNEDDESTRTFVDILRQTKSSLQSLTREIVFIKKDNAPFHATINISPILNSDKVFSGVVLVIADNTENIIQKMNTTKEIADKKTELDLVQSRLSTSVESLNIGLILIDELLNLVTINKYANELLHLTDSQSLQSMQKLFDDQIDIKNSLKTVMLESQPAQYDRLKLGNRIVSLNISPVKASQNTSNNSEILGAVLLIEDVTEQEIVQRSKDEFFSIASHELRTPLSSIKGNSSMILSYYEAQLTDPNLKEMVHDIYDASERMIAIVNDFLELSSLEQGKIKFKFAENDIIELTAKVISDLQPLAKEKGLKLSASHEDFNFVPKVIGDRVRIEQILVNILANAIKYTAKGGVHVSYEVNDTYVKTLISDSGVGISRDNTKLLFRKFQQANGSIWTRETAKGTGLGLYISQLLAEGMKGSVKLESSFEGKGSTFSVSLLIANDVNFAIYSDPAGQTIDSRTGLRSTDEKTK